MARLRPTSLGDRIARLQEQAEAVRADLEKLREQETYLQEQMEKAKGQLAYYETLLKDLRKRTVKREGMREVMGHL